MCVLINGHGRSQAATTNTTNGLQGKSQILGCTPFFDIQVSFYSLENSLSTPYMAGGAKTDIDLVAASGGQAECFEKGGDMKGVT